MNYTPARITALAATILISATAVSGCSIGSYLASRSVEENTSSTTSINIPTEKQSDSAAAPESTSAESTTDGPLTIDTTPFSGDELNRARQLTIDYFNGFRNGDFATICKLSTDSSEVPPLVIENAIDLKICEKAARAEAGNEDFSMLDFSIEELEAKDDGGGFASIYANGFFTQIRVVKLTNGNLYVDIADWM
jgi:hypothetical protein